MQDKVSKVINKFACEKYISYSITENEVEKVKIASLTFSRDETKIAFDQKHDGFYMVESTVQDKS
jgi:hypothetical protein